MLGAILILTVVALAEVMAQGPPIPGWLDRASPSEYALLEQDLPADMTLPTGIEAEAKAMALGYTDAQGNFVREDSYVLNVTENIEVAGDDPGHVSLYVAVLGSPEQTIAFARQHFQYGMNADWMVNGNDLGDARIAADGGSVKGPGRVIIRYRDVLASFSWNGRIDDYGTAKTEQVARLWLDKVAGPPGADLSLHPDRIVLKMWSDHDFVERETAADKQHVVAQINNRSQNVAAQGVQARLSVQMPGEDDYKPLQTVNLGNIAPGASRLATFEWDLKGEQITEAGLLVDAWAEGPRDTNPMDNQAGLEVSVYYAHNGDTAYRWRDDSYSFKNYSYEDDDFAAMAQTLLGTIVGEAYTDPQAGELISRMLFPQTYMRLVDYLHRSVMTGAGGHCYGMSATAGLYFMDGSLRPGGASTSALSRDAADPNIKLYQRAQLVPIARALINGDNYFERHFNSLSCLNIVRQKLRDERKPVILSMGGTLQVGQETKGWGHAVMAYKLVEVNGRDSAIYVYDPNIAPATNWSSHAPMSAFHIDPDDGGWNTSSDMSAIYDGGGMSLTRLAA
ncbi:MAG: hypothetical protein GF393_08045, partial [Armatimonadia bacterium]|nr:hypothetical protein [Armatimonadia bacterium]